VKKGPDWARWRAWLIAASATAVPGGATAACGGGVSEGCGYFSDSGVNDTSDSGNRNPRFSDAAVSASSCTPADISGGALPTWKPPTGFHQGQCTDVQAAAFVDCLSNLPYADACQTFRSEAANGNCRKCAISALVSPATAYGPLIEGTVAIDVNEPGCIAQVTGDVSATGCGAQLFALRQCEEQSCESNCPVPANDDGTAYNTLLACEKNAASTTCKAYANAATCAIDLERDAGVASVCAQTGGTFADNAKAMVKLFCGGITGDGGITDAGDAG
jgi:hypothetical protein